MCRTIPGYKMRKFGGVCERSFGAYGRDYEEIQCIDPVERDRLEAETFAFVKASCKCMIMSRYKRFDDADEEWPVAILPPLVPLLSNYPCTYEGNMSLHAAPGLGKIPK